MRPGFNPRSPCGERQKKDRKFCPLLKRFQSTLPVWGATWVTEQCNTVFRCFNPRSPCGERPDFSRWVGAARSSVSIHAPRVGSDKAGRRPDPARAVSIHAPRVGSDAVKACRHCPLLGFNPRSPCGERRRVYGHQTERPDSFNPRSPCGERQHGCADHDERAAFQSTLPVWGATWGVSRN